MTSSRVAITSGDCVGLLDALIKPLRKSSSSSARSLREPGPAHRGDGGAEPTRWAPDPGGTMLTSPAGSSAMRAGLAMASALRLRRSTPGGPSRVGRGLRKVSRRAAWVWDRQKSALASCAPTHYGRRAHGPARAPRTTAAGAGRGAFGNVNLNSGSAGARAPNPGPDTLRVFPASWCTNLTDV